MEEQWNDVSILVEFHIGAYGGDGCLFYLTQKLGRQIGQKQGTVKPSVSSDCFSKRHIPPRISHAGCKARLGFVGARPLQCMFHH